MAATLSKPFDSPQRRRGAHVADFAALLGAPAWGRLPLAVRQRFDRPDGSGTVWERIYQFDGHAPVVVTSVKQVEDGHLVEALGAGLRMRLQVFESEGALHFVSTGYYFQLGWIRIPLPGWLSPGTTHVVHEDQGDGRFRFTMRTAHAGHGALYDQSGLFS
jgi:hypothetical protein